LATACAGSVRGIVAAGLSSGLAPGAGGARDHTFTALSAPAETTFVPSALMPTPTTAPS